MQTPVNGSSLAAGVCISGLAGGGPHVSARIGDAQDATLAGNWTYPGFVDS